VAESRRVCGLGCLAILVLGAALIWSAPAQGKAVRFVVLSGPHIGDTIKADGGPNVPDKLNPGHTHGTLTPQTQGNQFTFTGKVSGKRGAQSESAEPYDALPKLIEACANAIRHEENALEPRFSLRERRAELGSDGARGALNDLRNRIANAHSAGQIGDAAFAKLNGRVETARNEDGDAATAFDQAMDTRVGSSRYDDLIQKARKAIKAALEAKRAVMKTLQTENLLAGAPDPGGTFANVDLGEGIVPNNNNDQGDAAVRDTAANPNIGWLVEANGTQISMLPPSTPGLNTDPTAIYNSKPGEPLFAAGNEYSDPVHPSCGTWRQSSGFMYIPGLPHCGIADGSDFGIAGFYRRKDNSKELGLVLANQSVPWKRAIHGFKLVQVGHFAGGTSVFTLNDKGLAFGDHFLSGESGPFRAFRADITNKGAPTTELWRPSGGSTQPIASNNAGLAGGGAVTSGGSVKAAFWWGGKHYTRFGGQGGALVNGMNELGVAVGSIGPLGDTHAALFEGGHAYDLNDLNFTSLPLDWVFTKATDINNQGQIVGNALLGGVQHGFELQLAP
jgi:hypothetical protein